ncbi:MAG: hypothetical protein LUQ24_00625 [Methanobacterium sp.]|jgi:hypothetical protein|nr:hypothetical protein [Methanobacterium sp.]
MLYELEMESGLEFEDEMDFEDEWFEEETIKELEQARGEKVIDTKKKRTPKSKNMDEIILVFEDTDSLDEEETYGISIKAEDIKIGKNDGKNGKFKKVGIAKLKENKFLEYITYHDDELLNTQLTLAFENGYSIELSGSKTIEEIKV